MTRSVLSLAIGVVALATALAVRHVPRLNAGPDRTEPDVLREAGAI